MKKENTLSRIIQIKKFNWIHEADSGNGAQRLKERDKDASKETYQAFDMWASRQ